MRVSEGARGLRWRRLGGCLGGPRRRAWIAGSCRCRTWGTGRRRGSRSRRGRRRSRSWWRAASRRRPRSRAPRSPAPPAWPSYTNTVSWPVAGCSSVDRPPTSHRSQVANSGSRPMAACSAAWAAPPRSLPGTGATRSFGMVQATATVDSVRSGSSSAIGGSLAFFARTNAGVPDHLPGHPHVGQHQVGVAPAHAAALGDDVDVGDVAGLGGVAGVAGFDQRHPVGQVEPADQVRLALVEVDGAVVDVAVRGRLVHGADQPPGGLLDHAHRPAEVAADRDIPGRAAVPGVVPAGRPPAQLARGAPGRRPPPRPRGRTGRGRARSAAARPPPRPGAGRARTGWPGRARRARPGGASSVSGWCTR